VTRNLDPFLKGDLSGTQAFLYLLAAAMRPEACRPVVYLHRKYRPDKEGLETEPHAAPRKGGNDAGRHQERAIP
jgi:hypothetical protein